MLERLLFILTKVLVCAVAKHFNYMVAPPPPTYTQSLLLLHYLILNGSERVVTSAREHTYDMKPLEGLSVQ